MHVCSAFWHCSESVHVCVCVRAWEAVKKERGLPSEAEFRASPSFPPTLPRILSDSLFIFTRSASLLRQTLGPFPFIKHSFISSAVFRLFSEAGNARVRGEKRQDEEKQNASRRINISGRRLLNRHCMETGADSALVYTLMCHGVVLITASCACLEAL